MNKLLLPLCLLGAALSTANTLFFSASTCRTEVKTMASVSDTASARAKDASPTPAKSSPARAASATAAARDQTGSLGNPLATSTPGQAANFESKPPELAKWAVVLLAAKAHSGPSCPLLPFATIASARSCGWLIVNAAGLRSADPISAQQGWIYEKYLTLKEESPTQTEPVKRSIPTAERLPRSPGSRWRRAYLPNFGFAIRVYPRW